MSEETPIQNMAPGLLQAFAPQEEAPQDGPRRRRRRGPDPLLALREWQPKTRLGQKVMAGEIISYEQALASGHDAVTQCPALPCGRAVRAIVRFARVQGNFS